MIETISGWSCDVKRDGLLLTPPEGSQAASIRYTDELRPLRRTLDIVRRLALPSGCRLRDRSPIESLRTATGEYAALVMESAILDGVPLQRTIGIAFADESYSLIVGLASAPALFDRVSLEVRRATVLDGPWHGARTRRYMYQPPAAWQGFSTGALQTTWMPLEYPRERALLTVHPALPIPHGQGDYAEQFVARLTGERVEALGIVHTATLSGAWWTVVGTEARHIVVLADEGYLYPVVIEAGLSQIESYGAVFRQVIDSIEPVPRAWSQPSQTTFEARPREASAYWAE